MALEYDKPVIYVPKHSRLFLHTKQQSACYLPYVYYYLYILFVFAYNIFENYCHLLICVFLMINVWISIKIIMR